jgi:hypothetical protein
LGFTVKAAYQVDMAEQYQETLPVQDGHNISLNVRGSEVFTLKLLPEV